jgi:hypothetical protein
VPQWLVSFYVCRGGLRAHVDYTSYGDFPT